MAMAVERLYNHNITTEFATLDTLIVTRMDLYLQLERWRQAIRTSWTVMSGSELQEKSPHDYDKLRFSILTSIYYYRTLLLINRPLITVALREWLVGMASSSNAVDSAVVAILKEDFTAAKELFGVINAIHNYGGAFLHRYTAWWLANYSCENTKRV
jgi:hypothetical protein